VLIITNEHDYNELSELFVEVVFAASANRWRDKHKRFNNSICSGEKYERNGHGLNLEVEVALVACK